MIQSKRLNPILRRLLQMDKPVPVRTKEEIAAERDKNYRWNFGVNLLDGASFWIGQSFIASATIVPLYISKLTDSPLAIGLAAVIAQSSWFLPQIFTSNFVERLPRKKAMVVNLGFFSERLPMLVIVLSAVAAAQSAELALVLFFLGYAWHGFGAGLVATSWQDLLARCFRVERRGRLFGITMFVGAGAGALAAFWSVRFLSGFPFPTNFIYAFSLAAFFVFISWVFLALTREPVEPARKEPQSQRDFWNKLPQILRQDDNFRHFLIARLLLAFSSMGIGFVTVAALRRWNIGDGMVGGFTAAYLIGQMAGNLAFGFLADKHGHKLSLEFAGLFSFLAFALAMVAPAPEWLYVVFVLLGAVLGAVVVSGIMVVMEFSAPEKRPTYTGLTNTAVGVVSAVGPLLGAALALAGFDWLFVVSAVAGLLSFIGMHWWVQEPRFAGAVGD
jgi:MFS family permease